MLASLCAPEALLAGIRTGTPPDLAWGQMMIDLTRNSSELATIWGGSIWDDGGRFEVSNPAERLIARFAVRMKNLIRLSLMEGRPCVDRIEGELSTLRAELRTEIERELQSLGARSLKPLFICVAPAVFGLLILGLFIGSTEMMREY